MNRLPAREGKDLKKMIEGVQYFQSEVFKVERQRFQQLAKGQRPQVLLVVCSDSRINPHLITQASPGDLFVLCNAGNIVPPHGASLGGEEATIEYAVSVLNVRYIIICGHSHCGAMKGLLHPESLTEMRSVEKWLTHAEATRRVITETYAELSKEEQVMQAAQENVIVQMNNLCTYPSVFSKLARGELAIHGWMYTIETGEVSSYEPKKNHFQPLTEQPSLALAGSG